MEDKQIIELYWNRLENAIKETSRKYGRYCHYIANNILRNKEDAEECVNESYWRLWNTIPPHRPQNLKAYLAKITRNLSLHMWEKQRSKKRGGGSMELVLEELKDCIPDGNAGVEQLTEQIVIELAFDTFLKELEVEQRRIFLARYWYFASIQEIASQYNMSESKVKMTLLRLRQKLKVVLEKEGIVL